MIAPRAPRPRRPRLNPFRVAAALALLWPAGGCLGSTEPTIDFPEGGTRVLFIGNSLTYVNDLPTMLSALARQAGYDSLYPATVAFPDYALVDHWNEGTARDGLETYRWEFVVMQQGPSSTVANQALLADWSADFAPPIAAAGAEAVL